MYENDRKKRGCANVSKNIAVNNLFQIRIRIMELRLIRLTILQTEKGPRLHSCDFKSWDSEFQLSIREFFLMCPDRK